MTASSGYVDPMVPAAESKLSSLSDDPGVYKYHGWNWGKYSCNHNICIYLMTLKYSSCMKYLSKFRLNFFCLCCICHTCWCFHDCVCTFQLITATCNYSNKDEVWALYLCINESIINKVGYFFFIFLTNTVILSLKRKTFSINKDIFRTSWCFSAAVRDIFDI